MGDGIFSFAELGLALASSGGPRASFQWGGTISAMFLLLLNRLGRQSRMQTHLLVLYLFLSFPTVLFSFLRGQFGCWVAFLAVGLNLFFPESFPVSRFILFVITPDWITNELRDGIIAGVSSLMIGIIFVVTEIRESGGLRGFERNTYCFAYFFWISLLFVFSVLYICLGAQYLTNLVPDLFAKLA